MPGRRVLAPLRGAAMSMIFQNPRAALNPIRPIGLQIADALRAHEPLLGLRGAGPRAGAAGGGPHPRPGAAAGRLPARAFGRHVPAGDDRHGDRLRAEPADRGRAHHRARRDDPEDRHGHAGRDHRAARHGDDPDHPRPRPGGAILRPGRGDGARPGGRGGRSGAALRQSPACLYAATGCGLPDPELDGPEPGRRASRYQQAAPVGRPRAAGGTGPEQGLRPGPRPPAVDRVSFHLNAGESLGLVGESGSGKSTISRLVCRLLDQTAGEIRFDGEDIGAIPARGFHRSRFRKRYPAGLPGPRRKPEPALLRLRLHRRSFAQAACDRPIARAADACARIARRRSGFRSSCSNGSRTSFRAARRPGSASPGRSPSGPKLLVLDEPTAALDVSVQAVVLHLLDRLRRETGLAYLFVSHDLNVVRMMCERTIVLQTGRLVEEGQSDAVFAAPKAAYTAELLAAIPHFAPVAEPA